MQPTTIFIINRRFPKAIVIVFRVASKAPVTKYIGLEISSPNNTTGSCNIAGVIVKEDLVNGAVKYKDVT